MGTGFAVQGYGMKQMLLTTMYPFARYERTYGQHPLVEVLFTEIVDDSVDYFLIKSGVRLDLRVSREYKRCHCGERSVPAYGGKRNRPWESDTTKGDASKKEFINRGILTVPNSVQLGAFNLIHSVAARRE